MTARERTPRVVLLCAGEIGYRALAGVVDAYPGWLAGAFSYRVEPPQEGYLDKIREACGRAGARFIEASNAGRPELRAAWDELDPDFVFAIKWRSMVPRDVLARARRGFVIFHASLLPKYRGFAPFSWPILNGEDRTGVTMFYAADEVDSGDVIDQRVIPLDRTDDVGTVEQKATAAVADMLVANLGRLADGTAPRIPQDESAATYVPWLGPDDAEVDWAAPTARIDALVRAFTRPYGGAFTTLDGRRLTVWRARPDDSGRVYVGRVPGRVERVVPGRGVNVLTGDGVVQLTELQLEGEPPRPAWEVVTKLKTQLGPRRAWWSR